MNNLTIIPKISSMMKKQKLIEDLPNHKAFKFRRDKSLNEKEWLVNNVNYVLKFI